MGGVGGILDLRGMGGVGGILGLGGSLKSLGLLVGPADVLLVGKLVGAVDDVLGDFLANRDTWLRSARKGHVFREKFIVESGIVLDLSRDRRRDGEGEEEVLHELVSGQ